VNYIVIIDVQNDQLKLMPGLTANVKILVASASNVLKVSNMALRFQPAADIIDTTGTGAARNGFMGKENNTADSSRPGRPSFAEDNGASGPSPAERVRFRAIRDSIQSAHGGKLSPEDLRTEMQKMFAGRMSHKNAPAAFNKPKSKVFGSASDFGIVSNYPEYQKGAYIPSHQSGRGRVWILKTNGLLESVFVRTGLNDGRFTEINSSRLKPGDQIVLGATSDNSATSQQVQSPLTSQAQGQRGPGGGGFR
jgi:HlyD family secretion protein